MLTLSGSGSRVKVIGQSSRSQEETVAKVVCVPSSEGFLVLMEMSFSHCCSFGIISGILGEDDRIRQVQRYTRCATTPPLACIMAVKQLCVFGAFNAVTLLVG